MDKNYTVYMYTTSSLPLTTEYMVSDDKSDFYVRCGNDEWHHIMMDRTVNYGFETSTYMYTITSESMLFEALL